MSTSAFSTGVSRRTVIGSAWAAPVIALAIASPLAAASGSGTGSDTVTLTPRERNLIGDNRAAIAGMVTLTGGTMPLRVLLSSQRTTGSGRLSLDPNSPAVSEDGSFIFAVDATAGSDGASTFIVTAIPDNTSDTTFSPGDNTLTVTVFPAP